MAFWIDDDEEVQFRRFTLDRHEDVSGVSGTGTVAVGVLLPTGRCVLEWVAGEIHSIVIYQSVDQVLRIHGHDGKTDLVWMDP